MNPRKVLGPRGLFDLKATTAVSRRARGEKLCVLARVHHLLVSIPIDSIQRLVLPSAATFLHTCSHDAPGLMEVEGQKHAAWDVGDLFGLGPTTQAWILLTLDRGDARVPIAFATGPCLAIEEAPLPVRLPNLALTARAPGIQGAFLPPSSIVARGGEYGLAIDPTRILSPVELDASLALLRREAAS
jgi:hypothetical protein